MVSALIFGGIELWRLGPKFLWQFDIWWVLGLIGIYAILIRLIGGIAELGSLQSWPVATMELWANLSVVVSVLIAALVLDEPLNSFTVLGITIVLVGVMLPSLSSISTNSKETQ